MSVKGYVVRGVKESCRPGMPHECALWNNALKDAFVDLVLSAPHYDTVRIFAVHTDGREEPLPTYEEALALLAKTPPVEPRPALGEAWERLYRARVAYHCRSGRAEWSAYEAAHAALVAAGGPDLWAEDDAALLRARGEGPADRQASMARAFDVATTIEEMMVEAGMPTSGEIVLPEMAVTDGKDDPPCRLCDRPAGDHLPPDHTIEGVCDGYAGSSDAALRERLRQAECHAADVEQVLGALALAVSLGNRDATECALQAAKVLLPSGEDVARYSADA